jgi:signal recognition particle GTPase
VLGILSAGDLDEDAWEEIEDTLIMADLGTKTTVAVVEKLRDRIAEHGVSSEDEAPRHAARVPHRGRTPRTRPLDPRHAL